MSVLLCLFGLLLMIKPDFSVRFVVCAIGILLLAVAVLMGAGLLIEGIMNLFAFYLLKKTITHDNVIEIDGKDL